MKTKRAAKTSTDAPGARRDEPAVVEIGTRLRHARLTKGSTLRQLAEQVGCTESFLSKVENDKVRPSLAILHRLVVALEINVATLFTESPAGEGPVAIMRNGERPAIRMDPRRRGRGIVLERILPNALAKLLEANIHHVAPKGSSDGLIQHDGEELGYVLAGRLELIVDGVEYLVEAGDSFFFDSALPHGYRNPGDVEASVLWVNTPISF
ncbi:MAG: cupin domain-containing protein [Alphaproteobacteria bacterium]|nr:cupin domain-containing protein [Alphaproteobacteria bacterium]